MIKKIFMSGVIMGLVLGVLSVSSIQYVYAQPSGAPAATGGTQRDYSGLVKCDGYVDKDASGRPIGGQVECNIAAIISMLQALISWFFGISGSVAALLFMYAGVLYLSSVPANIEKARRIFTHTGVGIFIVATAWLFVNFILGALVKDEFIGVVTTFFGK